MPVVQNWINANHWLKFNPVLVWPIRLFQILRNQTTIDLGPVVQMLISLTLG